MINLDKLWHYLVGLAIGVLTNSFLLVMLIASLKEVYDYYNEGHVCDANDLIATLVGGLSGIYFWSFLWT